MARMWQIRESYGDRKEMTDYECGYEDGYAAAMEDFEHMSERTEHKETRGGKEYHGERMGYRRSRM